MTNESRIQRASKHIDAEQIKDGRWAYYDDAMGCYYLTTTAELEIAGLVSAYESAVADIRRGIGLIGHAEDVLNANFSGSAHGSFFFDIRLEQALRDTRRKAWMYIINRAGIRSMMSTAAARQLDDQLDHDQLPEISIQSVAELVERYTVRAPEMLRDAVGEAFEILRPHHSRHKTNSELEVPRRVILERYIGCLYLGDKLHVRDERDQQLVAVENVLHSFAGMGSIAKRHASDLSIAIDQSPRGETDLFVYAAHRSGTLHLTFKDADLLARFNRAAGGRRLRPGS